VLLLRGAPKKKIWPDQYNGVGGHVKPDEDDELVVTYASPTA